MYNPKTQNNSIDIYGGDFFDQRRTLHIAYGIDENFVRPLLASIASVAVNSEEKIAVHIFVSDKHILKNDMASLARTLKITIYVHELPTEMVNKWPTGGWSLAIYQRFMMAPTLQEITPRFIYLDADVVCNEEISRLFDCNLDGKILGAVADIDQGNFFRLKRIFSIKRYFNSGVMVIDTALWVKENITEKLFECVSKNSTLFKCYDQDALNVVLSDQVTILDVTYNYPANTNTHQSALRLRKKYDVEQPVITHYMGGDKPWVLGVIGSDADNYIRYEAFTVFYNEKKQPPQNKSDAMKCFKNMFKEKKYFLSLYWVCVYFVMKLT